MTLHLCPVIDPYHPRTHAGDIYLGRNRRSQRHGSQTFDRQGSAELADNRSEKRTRQRSINKEKRTVKEKNSTNINKKIKKNCDKNI